MSRIPHSAKVLIRQVQERYNRKPDSKAGLGTGTPVGDPDGFNVIRSIKCDKTSSKWLKNLLPVLDDQRVAGFEEKDGHLIVHFSPRVLADSRVPFPLDDASVVADAGE